MAGGEQLEKLAQELAQFFAVAPAERQFGAIAQAHGVVAVNIGCSSRI